MLTRSADYENSEVVEPDTRTEKEKALDALPAIPGRPYSPDDAELFARPLTEAQALVANCLARGLSNKQIARQLGLSPDTIKVHLKPIFERLGVHTRLEAALKLNRVEEMRDQLALYERHPWVTTPDGTRMYRSYSDYVG